MRVNFRAVDELAALLCHWGEMELRHGHMDEALAVLIEATIEPATTAFKCFIKPAATATSQVSFEVYFHTRFVHFMERVKETIKTNISLNNESRKRRI